MSENRDSVDCVRIAYPVTADQPVTPGQFCWGPPTADGIYRLYVCLPGERHLDSLLCALGEGRPVPPGMPERCVWGWDGDRDKPTLKPSIHAVGVWHGWLRAGRLVSV